MITASETLAKLALTLNSSSPGAGLPPLVLLSDSRRLPDPAAAAAALPPGSAVILRNYDDPARAHLAHALAALCRARGLAFLVAADPALAAAVRADGVHFPEHMVKGARALRRRHPAWLITASAHGRAGLERAARAGAHAALLGPVFATLSHPGAPTLGPVRFAALVRASPLPVYALGGIDARTAPRLRGSGCAGLAAIGALAPKIRSRLR